MVVTQRPGSNALATAKHISDAMAQVKVAHAFGLRWKVSDEFRAVEEGCVDLAAFNVDPSWKLTMPARYVLAPGGTIEYADISVDYTRRATRRN
jgi:hypothetical protein